MVLDVSDWRIERECLRAMEQSHIAKQVPFYYVFTAYIFPDSTYALKGSVCSAIMLWPPTFVDLQHS